MPETEQSKIFDQVQSALVDRKEWEKRLARYENQRMQTDRQRVNNQPWPRSSNIRYPLSDTIIDQQKAFLFRVLYSSQEVANFKGMTSRAQAFNLHTAGYFDYFIKELTRFEREIQYCIDVGLQDGEALIKVMWDKEGGIADYSYVDNLYLITPSNTTELEDTPWMVHVLQYSKYKAKELYGRVKGFDELLNRIECGENIQNDIYQRNDERYYREGINASYCDGNAVLWEYHYMDDKGRRRLRTMSPDDMTMDFGDDREYPYEHGEWMILHYKRELVNNHMHSSRGIPQIVQEYEHALTSAWRAKQNAMTMYNAPIYSTGGMAPGSTGNVTLTPGTIVPYPLQIVQQGHPPISWDEEMANLRNVAERRVATPDFGLGRGNVQSESRTKYEVQQITNLAALNTELVTGNWRGFIKRIFQQTWSLIVQYKPQSLTYFLNNEATEIPPEALVDEYQIHVSGSLDGMNHELQIQKATALWQLAQNNPFANPGEIFKNLIEKMEPGSVQRFYSNPQQAQQRNLEKAASDITIMVASRFPITAKPGDDHYTSAVTAVQWLQAVEARKEQLNPQVLQLLSQYIASHREALKQTNRAQYNQLNQQLNQLDMAKRQEQIARMAQQKAALTAQGARRAGGAGGAGGAGRQLSPEDQKAIAIQALGAVKQRQMQGGAQPSTNGRLLE